MGEEGDDDARLASGVQPAALDVLEREDHLWIRDRDGLMRRLTADRVGEYDREALAAKQEEGRVILYWAAAPEPSPDGRLVAYATNREAVASDTSGQSIWLVDVADGTERPLLSEPGRSFRPIGWFRGEVLYFGDDAGVWAVDPLSRATYRVAEGIALEVARDGTMLVVAEGVPDSVAVRVLTVDDAFDVPAPPEGFSYLAQAKLAPSDRQLLLEAAAANGRIRQFVVFDIDRRRLHRVNHAVTADGRRLDPAHVHAYLEQALGFTSRDGRVFCSWAQLGAEGRALYAWVLCEEWVVRADTLETGSASSGPVVLHVTESGDGSRISSHERPRDGDRYARDLRALFPDDVRRRIGRGGDPAALRLVNHEIANRCFERPSAPCVWRGE